MSDRNYELYKRIMKHDSEAIDEINSLEEATEIIKLLSSTMHLIYLNGTIHIFSNNGGENQ